MEVDFVRVDLVGLTPSIHTLELKLWPFKVFPYVCIGKPCVCNVFRPRAT